MKFNGRACALAALTSLALAGCDKHVKLRYRLDVSVNDNGQTLTASSVREYNITKYRYPMLGVIGESKTHGDAMAIPLHDRLLVVTMGRWALDWNDYRTKGRLPKGCTGPSAPTELYKCRHGGDWLPLRALASAMGLPDPPENFQSVRQIAEASGTGRIELAEDELPILVTFQGPPKLENVRVVDAHDLAAEFGSGVVLNKVTMTLTSDPITRGVDKRLPFLKGGPRGGTCAVQSQFGADQISPAKQNINEKLGNCAWPMLFAE
jgi:hypothetical protein